MGDVLALLIMLIMPLSLIFIILAYTQWFNDYVKKHPKFERIITNSLFLLPIYLSVIMSFLFAVVGYDSLLDWTTSLIPWKAWEECSANGLDCLADVIIKIIFLLWAFLIPAHIRSWEIYKKSGKRPIYPYVINFLIGIILSSDCYFAMAL